MYEPISPFQDDDFSEFIEEGDGDGDGNGNGDDALIRPNVKVNNFSPTSTSTSTSTSPTSPRPDMNVIDRNHPIDSIISAIEHMAPLIHPIQIAIPIAIPTPIPSTLCAHPKHYHSFTRLTNLSTIVRSRLSTCAVCSERISIITGDATVTCVACSIFVHRKCMRADTGSTDTTSTGAGTGMQMPLCEVNRRLIEDRIRFQNEDSNVIIINSCLISATFSGLMSFFKKPLKNTCVLFNINPNTKIIINAE